MKFKSLIGFFPFLLLVLWLGTGCSQHSDKSAPAGPAVRKPSVMTVDAFVVKKKTISESIEVPGTLLANETTEIHPEVSGRLVFLDISEGRYVQKGTLLARIYDGDLTAQLKKLQVQLDIAKETEQRQAQLLKIQGISQQDYDLSLLSVNNLKADIDIVQTSISKTQIRAPYNGKLGLKNVSPGAYVTPTTVLTSIAQLDPLKLDFTVPEKYTERVKPGMLVHFTVEGTSKQFAARVIATESAVTADTRTLQIRALVENHRSDLTPGVFAKVSLNFDPDPNALMVPTQAIIPQARGKKIIVYNDGKAQFLDISTGVRDSAFVQVTNGLREGDTVVITGLLSIKPGSSIRVGKISE